MRIGLVLFCLGYKTNQIYQFALPVGLDIIGDVAGLVYAGIYRDGVNSALYSASIIIPFAQRQVLKGLLEGTLRLVRNTGDALSYIAKNARTTKELTYMLATHGQIAQELSEQLAIKVNQHANLSALFNAELATLVAKSGNGADDVITALNQLNAENLVELSLDLNKTPNFASSFFANVGENPGLVESWKRVADAIPTSSGTTAFARDIATLERVSELSDATSAFRKKFPPRSAKSATSS